MKVSLICSVHNEGETIIEILDSIFGQTRVPDEVILIEDSSTDNTYSLLRKYQTKQKKLKVVQVKTKNRSKNRNLGIQKSKGEFIVCVDAGCRLKKDYIEKILRCKEKNKGKEFFGGVTRIKPRNNFEKAYKILVERKADENYLPKGHAFCFDKILWKKTKGFDESLMMAEDTDFILRAKNVHQSPVVCGDAIVYWDSRKNFREVFEQFKNYGKWDGVLFKGKKNPKKTLLSLVIGIVFPLAICYAGLKGFQALIKNKNLVVGGDLFFLQLVKIYGYDLGFVLGGTN